MVEAKRRNKRVESISGALLNLGTALVAAVAVRLFDQRTLDWSIALWSIAAAALIWVGPKVIDLLEEEI